MSSPPGLTRSQGLPWGLPPFGYVPDRARRTYIIAEPQAQMVRIIFARHSQGGVSQYRIAKELNAAGMLRDQESPWTARQVGRVLDNPANVGRCVSGDELVVSKWEAIVDEQTWERARAVRDSDKRRISLLRAAKGGPYLLSGMLYCGYCGRRLVHRALAAASGQRDGIYVCVEAGESGVRVARSARGEPTISFPTGSWIGVTSGSRGRSRRASVTASGRGSGPPSSNGERCLP